MSWNKPEIRARVARINERWTETVADAVADGMRELEVDTRRFPAKAVTCLIVSFNKGIMLDGLTGFDYGHAELLDMIDQFLVRLGQERQGGRDAGARTE
jgi:hypothetical protein